MQIRSENWGIPDGVHLFAGTKYQENDDLRYGYERECERKKHKCNLEEKKVAVDYYLEHGRSLRRTIRAIGYPSVAALTKWVDELVRGERKIRITSSTMVQFSEERKREAVIALCTRIGPA